MELTISNKLYIKNPTNQFTNWCKANYIYDNPEYIKKQAMGFWVGNTPKTFSMYEKLGDTIALPYGTFSKVYERFKEELSVNCKIESLQPREYLSSIELYDYQREAVEKCLQAKYGVLVSPCGSGKSQMGLAIASRIGGRTLWVTHTQDLLNQSMERAKNCFGIKETEYGTITAGKVNIGNTMTFATVQTLSNIDLQQYTHSWDCIIVDEVQHLQGSPTKITQFYKVLSSLSATYKYGLTATPYRADGLDKCMFDIIGSVIHEVPRSAVESKTCPVIVRIVNTMYKPNVYAVTEGDGTINYTKLINAIADDKERNICIADTVSHLNGSALVLTDRVEHTNTLCNLIAHKRCERLVGTSKKEYRKIILDKLRNGELDVIVASYKIAKEGLDIPNLKYIVFATPVKDKTTVIQSAGRVGRKAKGKEYGTVIDFYDDFSILQGYYRQRRTIFKKLGYKIEGI